MPLKEKYEQAELSRHFYYDESSPSCLRRVTDWVSGRDGCTVRARAGDATGSLLPRADGNGHYYCVSVDGELFAAHVVVWLLHGHELLEGHVVDHLDGDGTNNRIANLRHVTDALNGRNQKKRNTNRSGTTGVHLREDVRNGVTYQRFVAQWHTLEQKRGSKSFSIDVYGSDEAFRQACEFRATMIEQLNRQGAGYTERHGA